MSNLADDDEEESLLFNLVYCSRAVDTLGSEDLQNIVSAAQRNNSQRSITGWLVYSHGIFFQWLEGAQVDVKRLMASISADPRHDTIVILNASEEVRGRVFADWDMELVSPEDIRTVLLDAANSADDVKNASALQSLIQELASKAVGTSENRLDH